MQIGLQLYPLSSSDYKHGKTYDIKTLEVMERLDLLWDEGDLAYEGTWMSVFGSYSPPCHNLEVAPEDKINFIYAISDYTQLRGLRFVLASGKEAQFGL